MLTVCGCSEKLTDYEEYYPENEIIFDNELDETSFQTKTDVKFVVVPIPIPVFNESFDTVSENHDDIPESESITVFDESQTEQNRNNSDIVWTSKSGTKYHCKPDCSNMKSPNEISLTEAIAKGYEPCKRCHK